MEKDLNTVLSVLWNTFELMNVAMKEHAEPELAGYTITEMHCIEHIGKLENPNVTKISQMLHITRGGVSKLIKKLMQRGAVVSYNSESNKKEIYYRLTPSGEKVFQAHELLHKKWNDKDVEFFKQFNDEEIKFAMDFIKKYTEHLNNTLAEETKC